MDGKKPKKTMVFVDVDNIRQTLKYDIYSAWRFVIPRLVLKIQETTNKAIASKFGSQKNLARIRYYHGWRRKPKEDVMPIRNYFQQVFKDNSQKRTIGDTVFSGELEFGD